VKNMLANVEKEVKMKMETGTDMQKSVYIAMTVLIYIVAFAFAYFAFEGASLFSSYAEIADTDAYMSMYEQEIDNVVSGLIASFAILFLLFAVRFFYKVILFFRALEKFEKNEIRKEKLR
jgi:hypothetical protein